jgi:hypothetical protein
MYYRLKAQAAARNAAKKKTKDDEVKSHSMQAVVEVVTPVEQIIESNLQLQDEDEDEETGEELTEEEQELADKRAKTARLVAS